MSTTKSSAARRRSVHCALFPVETRELRAKIHAMCAQTLQLILQPGEDLVADASNFCYASDNVVFEHAGLDLSAWLQGIAGG